MTVYRARRPWRRTREMWLIVSAAGYVLLLVAVCSTAGLLL